MLCNKHQGACLAFKSRIANIQAECRWRKSFDNWQHCGELDIWGQVQLNYLGARRWWQFNGIGKSSFPLTIGICSHKGRTGTSHALLSKVARTQSQVRPSPASFLLPVRVNLILPGLLLSECNVLQIFDSIIGGLKYGDEAIEGMKQLAPLKSTTDMGDCADAFVMLSKNGSRNFSIFATDFVREHDWSFIDNRCRSFAHGSIQVKELDL